MPYAPFEFRLTSRDGLSIACARWQTRGLPRGIVQIVHGLGEHFGRYQRVVEHLADAGLVVYGHDHRGHGRTATSEVPFGDFGEGGFHALVEDVLMVSRVARQEHHALPFVLIGHSMGSFAAQQLVLTHSRDIDGLVLSGSGTLDGLARLVALARASGVEPDLNEAFAPARTPFDWLSRDEATVDAFIADPLCFPALKPAAMTSLLAAAPRLAAPSALAAIRADLPVYLISGSEDPIGERLRGVRRLIERYQEAGLRNVGWDFYPGGRHEMFNELNRDDVQARLLTWVLERAAIGGVVKTGSGISGRLERGFP